MPFLSAIIPVYNVEKYLERCVESVVSQQAFREIEVLLVDDGSTDGSGSICDRYSEKYANIMTFHKENGGLSDARNYGIARAEGDYLLFLDSDDLIADGFIEDISKIIKDSQPDVICFECCYEKEANVYKPYGNKQIKTLTSDEHLMRILKNEIGNQICFSIFKKSLFAGIEFPVGKNYEDISTHYRLLLEANSVKYVNYSYYVYNITNINSITKTTSLKNISDMYCAVTKQCADLAVHFEENSKALNYLDYYKLDEYIYIYLKVRMELGEVREADELKETLAQYIKKNMKYNPIMIWRCNKKKYIYCMLLKFLGKL